MGDHSVYGPSSAHKWLNCPGSIKAEAVMPEPPETEFAHEGTCAHELAELCLRSGEDTNVWIGKKLLINKEWLVLPDMADNVQAYIDYVREIGGSQEYEQKVFYTDWVPNGYGTADVIATKVDDIYVIDLKYGKGVPVDAEENPQGMLYALGALAERSVFQRFKKVFIVIHQPRLDHISTWETTPEELYGFAEYAKERANLANDINPKRVPGEKPCRWCLAKAVCPALKDMTEDVIMGSFDEMEDTPKPGNLNDQALENILTNAGLVRSFLKAVEEHVSGRLQRGENFPGRKLVRGRSTRKWNDEEKAERLIRRLLGAANAYKKTLLTPPAAEKALGKEKKHRIEKLIFKPEGAPVLVSEDDKREAIKPITAEDF